MFKKLPLYTKAQELAVAYQMQKAHFRNSVFQFLMLIPLSILGHSIMNLDLAGSWGGISTPIIVVCYVVAMLATGLRMVYHFSKYNDYCLSLTKSEYMMNKSNAELGLPEYKDWQSY